MKLFVKSLALSAGFLLAAHSFAQTAATPSAKPAAKVTVANPMAPDTTAPTATTGATTAPAKSAAKSTSTPATAAPGGGAGKVWVNTKSKVYHCVDTKYYGKTKAGEYMSEVDAKAKGNHPNNKKACS